MVAGAIQVEWIQWGDHSVSLRGRTTYDGVVTLAFAYRHIASVLFVPAGDSCSHHPQPYALIDCGKSTHWVFFDGDGARDAAAELARRMEACT
jgi:hypothetical protein